MLLKTKLKSSASLALFQTLAICPALAVTTTFLRSLAITGALLVTLVLSAALVSGLRKMIPAKLRAPVYLLISSFSVTFVHLIMRAVFPVATASLGIYLPVLAVNCVIVLHLEVVSALSTPGLAVLDGLLTSAKFGAVMLGSGVIRELFGTGKLFASPMYNGLRVFPAAPVSFLAQPAGALLLIAAVAAVMQYMQIRRKTKAESLETV